MHRICTSGIAKECLRRHFPRDVDVDSDAYVYVHDDFDAGLDVDIQLSSSW